MAIVDWKGDETEEILEESAKPVKEQNTEEKLASGYCSVGEHKTKERLFLCKHCKRTYCFEHGDEDKGFCNECLLEYGGSTR